MNLDRLNSIFSIISQPRDSQHFQYVFISVTTPIAIIIVCLLIPGFSALSVVIRAGWHKLKRRAFQGGELVNNAKAIRE